MSLISGTLEFWLNVIPFNSVKFTHLNKTTLGIHHIFRGQKQGLLGLETFIGIHGVFGVQGFALDALSASDFYYSSYRFQATFDYPKG